VKTRMVVTRLGTVDSSTSEVEVSFNLQLLYVDPHLKDVPDPDWTDRETWDDEDWLDPAPKVQNQKGTSFSLVHTRTSVIGEKILREYEGSGVVCNDFDLRRFPFDIQTVRVAIESKRLAGCVLRFRPSSEPLLLSKRCYQHNEFKTLFAQSRDVFVAYDRECNGLQIVLTEKLRLPSHTLR